MEQTVVITSGYFDPIHVGHIEYLKKASELGDFLIVIVNNDRQASLKKGKPFMKEEDRLEIVNALKYTHKAVLAKDEDATVCATIESIVNLFPNTKKIIFAKGGDRHKGEIPEAKICNQLGIEIVDGLGEKIRSSSEYINSAK